MKIKIEIECDDIQELKQHLQMIKQQVNQKAKKLKLSEADELEPMRFEHDNCYGSHSVLVLLDQQLTPGRELEVKTIWDGI